MYTELTIKQEADLAHEQGVKRAAMEVARNRVLDVLMVAEQMLQRIRKNCSPGHDDKHRVQLDSVRQGESLVEVVLEALPDVVQINYQQLVSSVYDEDEQPLTNEEYVIDEVRNYVKQLLKGLKVKP